jgi:hypothetical protein
MTTTEVKYIISELDDLMKMSHLKEALPRMDNLKEFCTQMYKELKEEEIELANDQENVSEDSEPHTSDEEFVAGEGEVDYASESDLPELKEPEESDSDSDDSSSCSGEEGCTCEACKNC